MIFMCWLCPRSLLEHCNLGVSQEPSYTALDIEQGGQRTLSARSSILPPLPPLYTPIPIDLNNGGSISDYMAEQIEVGAVRTDREFGRKARYAPPFLSYPLWLMLNRIIDSLHKLKKQAHKRHARLLLVGTPKSLQLRKNWN